MGFKDRVAVVTGAGGNIGGEICRQFVEAGVRVAISDKDTSRVEAMAEEYRAAGHDVRAYCQDMCDPAGLRASFAQIESDFGKIDILVNNAGVWEHRDVHGRQYMEEMAEDEWEYIIDVNLRGTFRCMQCVLPGMLSRKYGRIINMGSIAGECGLPGYADYSAAKAGVIMLTKTSAMECGKRGVTVNVVSPGMIWRVRSANKGTWLGVSGLGSDIARGVLFLADDDAGYITGHDLTIDGGRILGPHNNDW